MKNRTHGERHDEWTTPTWLYEQLSYEFGPFTLDAAATAENAKCGRFLTKDEDGLIAPWTGNVWCNPPYGRGVGKWAEKAMQEARAGNASATLLLPASTDTVWFHDYCLGHGFVKFLRDRIRFNGADRAPFGSMVVVFRKRPKR